ncbi:MAG TPA: threonine--tRNA ligase [Myxococcota bacterium]|nr:threonine--tRNA ligase [Myxococcota bacterium]
MKYNETALRDSIPYSGEKRCKPCFGQGFFYGEAAMSNIHVILPDGHEKILVKGATSMDLAMSISPQLASRVVVAKVNDRLTDLQDPLNDGDRVVLLEAKAHEAQDVISHSCEHVLAAAVLDLFPQAQITMGPKNHEEGFYYDFDIGRPFSDEDLVIIEEKMAELIKQGISFRKKWLTKGEAKKLFLQLGQKYKPEILDWIPEDTVTIYESGNFVDLCRGPHLPNASFIKAFKLLGVSGSYWRGDSSKEMLQRISGIAFFDKKALDAYLFRIEEAKKRDHRKLGPKLGLFSVSERFGSWQDPASSESEIRVLVYVPSRLAALHGIIQKIEGLIAQLVQHFPTGHLSLRSFNVLPKHALVQQAEVDVRIFASSMDASARKDVCDAVQQFNHREPALHVKCQFENMATEEVGPGLVMWLPRGGRLRSIIEDFSRRRHFAGGYDWVYSPHIAKSDLWRISGHLGFYQDSMFAPINVDGNEYLLKPMNCPFHVLMFKHSPRSYRDLPCRYAEFGTVYRYELAGVLHGLMRVRGFTQDDAHIFCRWDQLDHELDLVLKFVIDMLTAFGFEEFVVNISTRPEKYVGELSMWAKAEESLRNAIERAGMPFVVDEGGGAFYGPKIDIKLKDCLGRMWQCSTLQLDFNNPERFDLLYVNNHGEKVRPVMLHRALFGSIERFIGVLIEHYAGAFPAWLCPEQVRILTVSERHNSYATELLSQLKNHGLRAEFKDTGEKLGAKIREAQLDKIPLMVVVGDKEVAEKGGTLRLRSQEDKGFFAISDLINEIKQQCQEPL